MVKGGRGQKETEEGIFEIFSFLSVRNTEGPGEDSVKEF